MSSLNDRFWAKVEKTPTCWLWTAAVTSPKKGSKHKYGVLGRGGRGAGNIRAHVLSYELHYGPVPDGLLVRHKCDVTLCVNPEHLEVGTQTDNMQDASKRGRIRNQNTDKKFCVHGHTLSDAYIGKNGRRVCKHCVKIQNARRYA